MTTATTATSDRTITQQGTHDDVFWATALAVYATANMQPEPTLTVIPP